MKKQKGCGGGHLEFWCAVLVLILLFAVAADSQKKSKINELERRLEECIENHED